MVVGAISSIVTAFLLIGTFLSGKRAAKNQQNEQTTNEVQNLNSVKANSSRLSDNDLNNEVQKWERSKD